ncbi:LysR family transcriptional regulator [Labilithrix luteola]|nr:LysR family transcriptional regulator [Labilithrix luteola]
MNRVHELPFAEGDARVFSAVAAAGSFTTAASLLRMTPSAVSKAITRLEAALHVRLLARTTRALHLTDEGAAFHERCVRAFGILAEAAEEASAGTSVVTGIVRIGLPPLFGTYFLPRVLAGLLVQHPRLRVDLVSTMNASDVVDRGLDLAIIVGDLRDSSLVSRPLGYGQFVTVAAKSYLQRAGTPRTPDDLSSHRCLAYTRTDGRSAPWVFGRGDANREVSPNAQLRSDDMHHLASMAVEGLGIAHLPLFVVTHDIDAGRLVRLLGDDEPEPKPASLVHVGGRTIPLRIRTVIDFLVASELQGTTSRHGTGGRAR